MSQTEHASTQHAEHPDDDSFKDIMHLIPIVLPVVGGVLIFLLAFIAVAMA
jgi:hypothetical protein